MSFSIVNGNSTQMMVGDDGTTTIKATSGGMAAATIDGKRYEGGKIVIKNGEVYVDGSNRHVGEDVHIKAVSVVVEGDVGSVSTQSADVTVRGNADSVSNMSGDVTVYGNCNAKCSTMTGNIYSKNGKRSQKPSSPQAVNGGVIGDGAKVTKKRRH